MRQKFEARVEGIFCSRERETFGSEWPGADSCALEILVLVFVSVDRKQRFTSKRTALSLTLSYVSRRGKRTSDVARNRETSFPPP